MQRFRTGFETIDFPFSLVRSDFPVFGFVLGEAAQDGRCDLFERGEAGHAVRDRGAREPAARLKKAYG